MANSRIRPLEAAPPPEPTEAERPVPPSPSAELAAVVAKIEAAFAGGTPTPRARAAMDAELRAVAASYMGKKLAGR